MQVIFKNENVLLKDSNDIALKYMKADKKHVYVDVDHTEVLVNDVFEEPEMKV